MAAPKRRVKARDGDFVQARRRVQTLVDNGVLPRARDAPCVDCGNQAREYDHHLGYGPDHHEDVEAVCAGCHHRREARRRGDGVRIAVRRARSRRAKQ